MRAFVGFHKPFSPGDIIKKEGFGAITNGKKRAFGDRGPRSWRGGIVTNHVAENGKEIYK